MSTDEIRKRALSSLNRMQEFDPQTLVRTEDFGRTNDFRGAVEPAMRLINLYKQLHPTALQDFPPEQLNSVLSTSNRDYQLFEQILKLDPAQGLAASTRDQYVNQIDATYQPTFSVLHPLIGFSLHRVADFAALERDSRAALQGIRDQANEFRQEVEAIKSAAETALEQAQKAAAEHGVTQQAIYFRDAAKEHSDEANSWQKATWWWAGGLAGYAILSLFLHRIPLLIPRSTYDALQLSISKVLIFAVLSYMLYLSARNFIAHRHNAIINRHRQNALMTYEAIVTAAKEGANQDVVLNHAAACIFSPQPTGYSGDGKGESPGPKSIVEVFARHGSGE